MQTQMKKRLGVFLLAAVVVLTVMFVECNVYFPDRMHLYCGERPSVREGSPYTLDMPVSGTLEATGSYNASVKLFGLIPVKSVAVDVVSPKELMPGGKTVGIKLFTKGLMCVGTEKLTGTDGTVIDAAHQADLRSADLILKADGIELHTVEQFGTLVEQSGGKEMILTVERGGKKKEVSLTPVRTKTGYKLGIWVRDSTAGIGTITYTDPKNNIFGALGHPITDVDTGAIMPVEQGSISDTEIVEVKKGERGVPGELCGLFHQSKTDRGVILKNSAQGIYGVVENSEGFGLFTQTVAVASKTQVETGKAQIYANVTGDQVECFDVEITKVMRHAPDDKNMVVKITDPRLLSRTGGIVQGMSGSPIIQNGKLIGAVTHVFVNDPTRGYGIFIENMLAEAEKIR